MDIFITEWHISDYDGRRCKSIKSQGTINGEHVYACERLSTWFRLGKYLIKHDIANYLLGITQYINNPRLKDNVKYREHLPHINKFVDINCVDDIVRIVNEQFGKDFDYIKELLMLQEELKGYESCYYHCACYRFDFDYHEFLKDKDKYQRQVWRRVKILRFKRWLHGIIHKIRGYNEKG